MLNRFVCKSDSNSLRIVEAASTKGTLEQVVDVGKRLAAVAAVTLSVGAAVSGAAVGGAAAADMPTHGAGSVTFHGGITHSQDTRPTPAPIVEIMARAEGRADEQSALNALRDIRNLIQNPFVIYSRAEMAAAGEEYNQHRTPQSLKDSIERELGSTAATTVEYDSGNSADSGKDLRALAFAAKSDAVKIAAWAFPSAYDTAISDTPYYMMHVVTPNLTVTKQDVLAGLASLPTEAIKHAPGTDFHYLAAITLHEAMGHGSQKIDMSNMHRTAEVELAQEVDADRAGLSVVPQDVRDAFQWSRLAGSLYVAANTSNTVLYGHATGPFDMSPGNGSPDEEEVKAKINMLKGVGDAIAARSNDACRQPMRDCDHQEIAGIAQSILVKKDAGLNAEQMGVLAKYLDGYRAYTNLPDPTVSLAAADPKTALEKFRAGRSAPDPKIKHIAEPLDEAPTMTMR